MYRYLGKIVNTHGIKGEVRIISDIDYKDRVFTKGFNLYIGSSKQKETINTYRVHKNFDMVTFDGISNINDVLKYKGEDVYILKSDIEGITTDEDYIGLDAYTDKFIGKVTGILKGYNDILVIENDTKKYMVPKLDNFIKNIDFENKKIIIENIKGLIDED
ncbi:MAG: 16S rRNA processing protein RimM [Bacilli bacterium]|nr:16S rRNA processing protein RimM [Bacilli bacterium]